MDENIVYEHWMVVRGVFAPKCGRGYTFHQRWLPVGNVTNAKSDPADVARTKAAAVAHAIETWQTSTGTDTMADGFAHVDEIVLACRPGDQPEICEMYQMFSVGFVPMDDKLAPVMPFLRG